MTYWLPLRALVVNRPVLSIYSLLWCSTFTCNSFTYSFPGGGFSVPGNLSLRVLAPYPALVNFCLNCRFTMSAWLSLSLVEWTFWRVWTMWPFKVSSAEGQYRRALLYVNPGQVIKFPALIAVIQVERTEYPAAARKYLTNASTDSKS